MVNPSMSHGPEDPFFQGNDPAEIIVEEAAELLLEDPYSMSRRALAEPLVFFGGDMDEMERWDTAEAVQGKALGALGDERLGSLVTTAPTPQRIFWRTEDGNPVETVITRFHEALSLATEVQMDDRGRPMSVMLALWQGDEQAVEEFLDEHPIKTDDVGQEFSDDPRVEEEQSGDGRGLDLNDIEARLQGLAGHPRGRLLMAALMAVGAVMELQSGALGRMATFEDSAEEGGVSEYRIISAWKLRRPHIPRIDVSRPTPGTVHNGFVPPPVNLRNNPIKQPRPQSGARRGKRVGL